MITLDPFYPIVPDTAWLARLLPQGIKLVQLRLKDALPDTVRSAIAEALRLSAPHGCQLIVNDYWREAIEAGADFIHLGQEDLASADLSAIKSAKIRIGISTHSRDELAIALKAEPDYVALGPIYPTKLKVMPWAPQGLGRIAEWQSIIPCPLVAIGGLTIENVADVLQAGATSAAVVTDIVRHADPEQRTRAWLAATAPWRQLSTNHPQG